MSVTIDKNSLMTKEEFEVRIRNIGKNQYHNLHQFHKFLHGGKLNKGQVQAWALNRYYYQCNIPIKDCALMSRMKDPELRRRWRKRILDHDGSGVATSGESSDKEYFKQKLNTEDEGGIERWLLLTDSLGLDRDYVKSTEGILPITRYACDAYVDLLRKRPVLEGMATSLSVLFAPNIHKERIAGMMKHYKFTNEKNMSYFQQRLTQGPAETKYLLKYVLENAKTREEQENVCNAIIFKMQMLWAQLDGLHYSYCTPGLIPPGAFVPKEKGWDT